MSTASGALPRAFPAAACSRPDRPARALIILGHGEHPRWDPWIAESNLVERVMEISAKRLHMDRQSGYEDLEHRLVIEWGSGALAWHQRASNKPVVQILPPGERVPLFKDYLGFTLSYSELRYVFAHADANSEWRARLAAVAGVYLILATTTGHRYVGSA